MFNGSILIIILVTGYLSFLMYTTTYRTAGSYLLVMRPCDGQTLQDSGSACHYKFVPYRKANVNSSSRAQEWRGQPSLAS